MKLQDRKAIREHTLGGHWSNPKRIDWASIYRELGGQVRVNRFYQETRGCTDEYIAELERLQSLALAESPKCEWTEEACDKPAYMLHSWDIQRCGALHLTGDEAIALLITKGYASA